MLNNCWISWIPTYLCVWSPRSLWSITDILLVQFLMYRTRISNGYPFSTLALYGKTAKSFNLLYHSKNHPNQILCDVQTQGRLPLAKRMNFRKSSKRQLTPPLIFRKVVLQIFSEIHDRSIVYNGKNLQYKFLDWKWPPPLWNFSENSSILEGKGVPKGSPQLWKKRFFVKPLHKMVTPPLVAQPTRWSLYCHLDFCI